MKNVIKLAFRRDAEKIAALLAPVKHLREIPLFSARIAVRDHDNHER